jgi:dimethylhistidine N-methyltransferase
MPDDSVITDVFLDLEPDTSSFRDDAIAGLSQPQKRAQAKYLYDRAGSELFDRICELDEYYPTRTEIAIMRDNLDDMADRFGEGCVLVELGSGSSLKTRILLDALDQPAAYIPIEISREHLIASAESLRQQFDDLNILPVCADFLQPLRIPAITSNDRRFVFFPGSTIGNFPRQIARRLLSRMRDICAPGGGALIGVDLKKDTATLEAAYNDSEGVTAEFNLNLLRRMNRELDADFDLDAFEFRATWRPDRGCVESRLYSLREQEVTIDGESIPFAEGESIHTEDSHKFEIDEFAEMADEAGLRQAHVWTDPDDLFSIQYLEPQ